jgi:predicted transcriptional regulator
MIQMEKVRITIEVDPKLKEAFLQKAKKEGRTMKWLIKEYIKKYID